MNPFYFIYLTFFWRQTYASRKRQRTLKEKKVSILLKCVQNNGQHSSCYIITRVISYLVQDFENLVYILNRVETNCSDSRTEIMTCDTW